MVLLEQGLLIWSGRLRKVPKKMTFKLRHNKQAYRVSQAK